MGDDDESPHEMHKASHTGGCCGSRLDIHGIDGRGSGTEEAIYTDACEGSDESRYIKYKGKNERVDGRRITWRESGSRFLVFDHKIPEKLLYLKISEP